MLKRSLLILMVMALSAMGVTAYMLVKEDDAAATIPLDAGTAIEERVTVYVTGAVRRPGVVTLPAGRVEQAVEASGGATPDADLAKINLAMPLKDGQHIIVPGAPEEEEAAATTTIKPDGLVHINAADEKALEALPGIGPVMAKRIVEYRQQNGPFSSLEELKKVRGIGEAKFARLKDKAAL